MSAPTFLDSDFVQALKALLPRGRAWPREPQAVLETVLNGLAATWARNAARANQLLAEAMPTSTLELLPEWEESLGLPDKCAGDTPTIAQRRAQVVVKFTNSGGQSIPYYIAFALALGYTITITTFAPFHFGAPFGLPLSGQDWLFAWQVNAPLFSVERFRFGVSGMGEPFANWSNDVLECELEQIKPAHTIIIFAYS